jgi:hypothetical protein
MSKNDGALVAFRDENDEMLNASPVTVSVSLNIDEKTGMSKPPMSKPVDEEFEQHLKRVGIK